MCTTLVRLEPDAAWPLRIAFVRDEDRDRETDAPGFWWPDQPTVIGGHDRRAGGTWLAVDLATGMVAMLTNHFDPFDEVAPVDAPTTRGGLPLQVLREGTGFDPATLQLPQYEPFHLVRATTRSVDHWLWDGHRLHVAPLGVGTHVVASLAPSVPGEPGRRGRLVTAFSTAPPPEPDLDATPEAAWGPWIDLIDGSHVPDDDHSHMVLRSVRKRPGFGTVGGSLIGVSASGDVRYDVNRTRSVAPDAWTRVVPAVP